MALHPSLPGSDHRIDIAALVLTVAFASALGLAASCAAGAKNTGVFPGPDSSTPGVEGGGAPVGDGPSLLGDGTLFFPPDDTGADVSPDGDAGCAAGCADFPATPSSTIQAVRSLATPRCSSPASAGTGTTTGGLRVCRSLRTGRSTRTTG